MLGRAAGCSKAGREAGGPSRPRVPAGSCRDAHERAEAGWKTSIGGPGGVRAREATGCCRGARGRAVGSSEEDGEAVGRGGQRDPGRGGRIREEDAEMRDAERRMRSSEGKRMGGLERVPGANREGRGGQRVGYSRLMRVARAWASLLRRKGKDEGGSGRAEARERREERRTRRHRNWTGMRGNGGGGPDKGRGVGLSLLTERHGLGMEEEDQTAEAVGAMGGPARVTGGRRDEPFLLLEMLPSSVIDERKEDLSDERVTTGAGWEDDGPMGLGEKGFGRGGAACLGWRGTRRARGGAGRSYGGPKGH